MDLGSVLPSGPITHVFLLGDPTARTSIAPPERDRGVVDAAMGEWGVRSSRVAPETFEAGVDAGAGADADAGGNGRGGVP